MHGTSNAVSEGNLPLPAERAFHDQSAIAGPNNALRDQGHSRRREESRAAGVLGFTPRTALIGSGPDRKDAH